MSYFKNYVSLDELTEDGATSCSGMRFDPTLEAAALREEHGESFTFTAAQIVDWDDFAMVLAAYVEREKAEARNTSAMLRKYENRKQFAGRGRHQVLPNLKCKTCGSTFRPWRSTSEFCSTQCAHSKNGAQALTEIAKRLSEKSGHAVSVILNRMRYGWSEEKIISTPIKKYRPR